MHLTPPVVRIIRPLRDVLRTQAASGLLLIVAAVTALILANSPWQHSYENFWASKASVGVAGHVLALDLRHWVNDGLMTLFFFVAGLEINRELNEGELSDRRSAALPVVAAVGGMAVPALLFTLINLGGAGSRGWGVPMATDIAMALGVLALLGSRARPSLKLFVLALAIVDDIGAIVVIALFYSAHLRLQFLIASSAILAGVVLARWVGVTSIWAYAALGVLLWWCLHESGVHATLAGVAMGLLAPTKPITAPEFIDEAILADVSNLEAARETVQMARQSVSVVEWLEHMLQPWTSYLIVPLFAFANAGISLDRTALSDASTSRITYGVIIGLVVGKTVGITLAAWLAVRVGVAVLPDDVRWSSIVGAGALAGMGFTVSIFVAGLAFGRTEAGRALESQAKLGILVATVLSGVAGWLLIRRSGSDMHRVSPATTPATASRGAASP